jgi:hypothetical protein
MWNLPVDLPLGFWRFQNKGSINTIEHWMLYVEPSSGPSSPVCRIPTKKQIATA